MCWFSTVVSVGDAQYERKAATPDIPRSPKAGQQILDDGELFGVLDLCVDRVVEATCGRGVGRGDCVLWMFGWRIL